MFHSLATFIFHNRYISIALIGIFWACVGLVVFSPIHFLDSVYKALKTPTRYHFRNKYKIRRSHHIREAMFARNLFMGSVLVFLALFVMPRVALSGYIVVKENLVEHKGFEPLTSSMPWKRASQLR